MNFSQAESQRRILPIVQHGEFECHPARGRWLGERGSNVKNFAKRTQFCPMDARKWHDYRLARAICCAGVPPFVPKC